ncbi:MAG: hypothetical protein L6Q54_11765 [Leptospiraceae bacterium]|nr:hypothetical protein [Leptospiraceae bacterium]
MKSYKLIRSQGSDSRKIYGEVEGFAKAKEELDKIIKSEWIDATDEELKEIRKEYYLKEVE